MNLSEAFKLILFTRIMKTNIKYNNCRLIRKPALVVISILIFQRNSDKSISDRIITITQESIKDLQQMISIPQE